MGQQAPARTLPVEATELEARPDQEVAFGVGLNLARAFHFGSAWAPDSSSNDVLIGVAIPELLPLLSGLGGSPGAPP